VDHVLARFNADERTILGQVVDRARDAAETVLAEGTRTGMDRFNVKGTEFSSQ
jgi:peptidyl-tRNA hydrolase